MVYYLTETAIDDALVDVGKTRSIETKQVGGNLVLDTNRLCVVRHLMASLLLY